MGSTPAITFSPVGFPVITGRSIFVDCMRSWLTLYLIRLYLIPFYLVLRETLWVSKLNQFIMVNFLFIPRRRDKTNHPDRSGQGCDPDSCRETAVTESLLPFINGPSLLKFVNWFLAGMIKGPRRSSSSLNPPIFSRPKVSSTVKFHSINIFEYLWCWKKSFTHNVSCRS